MPRIPRLTPFLLASLFAAPFAAYAAPIYSITNMGSIGKPLSSPSAINSSGQAVGYAVDGANVTSAFISTAGVMTNLQPAGVSSSIAMGINNAGVVVGQVSRTDGVDRAAVFAGGGYTDLGSFGGANTSSYAAAINNSSQVAGTSFLGVGGPYNAFLSTIGGGMLNLGTLGGVNSIGRGINDAGAVVGNAELAGGLYHGFSYYGGAMHDLGTLGGTRSDAYAINSAGSVVGTSFMAGDGAAHAFFYTAGGIVDLGTLGGANSYAYGINTEGQVVGSAEKAGGVQAAVLYSGGTMIDLNSLIDASSGWNLTYAAAINDKHQIAANGCNAAGACQALLLTLIDEPAPPVGVPEPESFSALLVALGLAGFLARRRKTGTGSGPL